jgi:hypothetical protein
MEDGEAGHRLPVVGMLTNPKRVVERDMLRTWLIAEFGNAARWSALKDRVPAPLLKKCLADEGILTEPESVQLEAVIRIFRGPLLDGLLPIVTEWYAGGLPVGELSQLRIINFAPFVAVASCRMFERLVDHIETGRQIADTDLAENCRRISTGFDIGRMRGRPILVGETINGPYFLVEGYTRCSLLGLHRLEYSG